MQRKRALPSSRKEGDSKGARFAHHGSTVTRMGQGEMRTRYILVALATSIFLDAAGGDLLGPGLVLPALPVRRRPTAVDLAKRIPGWAEWSVSNKVRQRRLPHREASCDSHSFCGCATRLPMEHQGGGSPSSDTYSTALPTHFADGR